MPGIRTAIVIERTPGQVWSQLADIERHTEWMADAEAIRFTSPQRRGAGTTFECDTRVGPLRLVDHMEITEWRDAEVMGVRHVGLVTGTGRFTLAPVGDDATVFTWTETLRFPRWMGGSLGALVAQPVLRAIWRGNLRRLRRQVEDATGHPVR